jgi:Zn-finger nucleic acid-binding protein
MKCPSCSAELVELKRDGVDAEGCPACRGTWLSRQELDQLENKAFDLGDDEKGSLVFSSTPSDRKCPQCGEPMRTFSYRLYDLELEYCEAGHGYWLDADEDKRVLDLMREEEARVMRSVRAEDRWSSLLRHLRSHGFIDRLGDLLR